MRILISLLFILILLGIQASESFPTERHFDPVMMDEYRSDKTFDYSLEYAQSDQWITLLLIYFLQMLADFFDFTGVGSVFPIVLRVLLVLIVAGLVYFIIRNKYGKLFVRESKQVFSPIVSTSSGEYVDYDKLLKDSLNKEDYKLAIRFLFLKSLHALHYQKELKITTWKAPLDYLKELKNEKRAGFKDLVKIFESTWYGDYPADSGVYQESEVLAKQLINE